MGGGGVGKKPKKIHARENAKKKNSCKEEGKEKKFMQKEGPIVIFILVTSANKHVKMHGVDRPARLPLCVRCVDKNLFSFPFTSMSLSDFSLYQRFFPFDQNVMRPLCLMVFILIVRGNSQIY